MLELEKYDVSPERGFLPSSDPVLELPLKFSSWEKLSGEMPGLLVASQFRSRAEALPTLEIDELADAAQQTRAMRILTFFASAYVWGDPSPATKLPATIAVPLWQLSEQLGRPPIISHASLVLNNWRRLDSNSPIVPENLVTLNQFLGGQDEAWFYLLTAAIEAAGGPVLSALLELQDAVDHGDKDACCQCLQVIKQGMESLQTLLNRMPEKCAPFVFYHRVRPFLDSWPAPGVVYEGVSDEPKKYFGGSAAQSSLIQALDAGLGVTHPSEHTHGFLLEMRKYMPPPHRKFIEVLESSARVKSFVAAQKTESPQLAELYNGALGALEAFRIKHLEIAARYISQQAKIEGEKGTGGTDFMKFLGTARRETRASRISK